MIKRVDLKTHRMHFRTPFKIAYEEVETADVVTVALTDEFGNVGLGSAAPDPEVTGETVPKDAEILAQKLTADFLSIPVSDWVRWHERIERDLQGFPSAQSAAEEAALNLCALQKKIPLGTLFGETRDRCPIMITVGIKDLKGTAQEVQDRLKEGFEVIKLKIGLDAKEDLERIQVARSLIPSDKSLVLDANQGYSFRDAEWLIQKLGATDIAALEQPVAAEDLEGLKALHRSTPIPLIADEAVVSAENALRILEGDFASGVNIKLMKCGGPFNFIRIYHLAKRLKKKIMIGCMYESNISITTGANLALALDLDFADLDSGHLDFDDDPVVGGAVVERGAIRIGSPLKLRDM